MNLNMNNIDTDNLPFDIGEVLGVVEEEFKKMVADMQSRIDELNYATEMYNKGTPIMSDKEWDDKYFELACMELDNEWVLDGSPTQIIYDPEVDSLKKVAHNHKMLSLAKTKNLDDVNEFLNGKSFVGMAKMDGLTCSLTYKNGVLVGAETRGNGLEGEDIFHNAMVIENIPKRIRATGTVIIDGEIICTYENFEKYQSDFKNPRNFAAGSIRLLNSAVCKVRNLSFIAWDLIEGSIKSNLMWENLVLLAELGFEVVPWATIVDEQIGDIDGVLVAEGLVEHIKDLAKKRSYPIDGLVFKFNDIKYGESLGSTSHHFNNAIAYKFYDETYETSLKYIEWTMGRTGVLTPVAVFEPIDIDGTTVERASLHNVSVMKDIMGDCCYAGQKIEVYKANQIIPQIKSAIKMNYGDVIAQGGISVDGFSGVIYCPICGKITDLATSDSGIVNLICSNENCEGKLINRLDHFCGKKGLDIKGLSKATLEKLINWGWIEDLEDIFFLEIVKDEWIKKPGFGEKSVNKILNAIEVARHTTLDKAISAVGIPLIGQTIAKDLAKKFKTYSVFKRKIEQGFDFSTLDGYGPEMKKSLLTFDYTQLDALVMHCLIDIQDEEVADEKSSQSNILKDKTFVITGKLKTYKNRDALKEVIEAYGGKVSGTVSGKTSYLINNDKNSSTAKNKSAKDLGVPIITEEEFNNMLTF